MQSAAAWLRGYRTLSSTDSTPSSWTTRVAPVVAGELATEYRGYQDSGGGAEWASFVAQRCATTVNGASAVIPAEEPRSATEVYAQVQGDVITTCALGTPPGDATEHVAATLELQQSSDRRWRVTRRVF